MLNIEDIQMYPREKKVSRDLENGFKIASKSYKTLPTMYSWSRLLSFWKNSKEYRNFGNCK